MKRFGSYRPLTPKKMGELEDTVVRRDGRCYFADHNHQYGHRCEGRTWAAHLYPQSGLKNAAGFKYGAWRLNDDEQWRPRQPYTPDRIEMIVVTLADICADPRNAVAMCDSMHGVFDQSAFVRRKCFALLPDHFEEFYREYGIEPEVERYYSLAPFALGDEHG